MNAGWVSSLNVWWARWHSGWSACFLCGRSTVRVRLVTLNESSLTVYPAANGYPVATLGEIKVGEERTLFLVAFTSGHPTSYADGWRISVLSDRHSPTYEGIRDYFYCTKLLEPGEKYSGLYGKFSIFKWLYFIPFWQYSPKVAKACLFYGALSVHTVKI